MKKAGQNRRESNEGAVFQPDLRERAESGNRW
jgi:hypothetical protein